MFKEPSTVDNRKIATDLNVLLDFLGRCKKQLKTGLGCLVPLRIPSPA